MTEGEGMKFGIIGAAGYVAPKHMQAIVACGGEIVTACDGSDSVGVLDRWAPKARFAKEPYKWFEALDDVDTVVVCTPNCWHREHMIRALAVGCNVVLEKPVDVDGGGLLELGAASTDDDGLWVAPVLQLRLHPIILAGEWRTDVEHYEVEINYEVYRGPWYDESWKGDEAMSGGLLVNIGVHLFDLAIHMFGEPVEVGRSVIERHRAAGTLELERATVTWRLRSDAEQPRRVFSVNGLELDLSNGMAELHEAFYRRLMACDELPTLADAMRALQLIDRIKAVAS